MRGGAQEVLIAMGKGVAVYKQWVGAKRRPVQAEGLRVPQMAGIRALSSFVPGPQRNVDEKPSHARARLSSKEVCQVGRSKLIWASRCLPGSSRFNQMEKTNQVLADCEIEL